MADYQKCVSANPYHEGHSVSTQPVIVSPADKTNSVDRYDGTKDWSYLDTLSDKWTQLGYYYTEE